MGIDFVIIGLIYKYPEYAHWVIFGSLILAGFNLPISEDLMLLTSGVLASAFVPENALLLWGSVFLGAYLSDWIAYWTGRLLGPKLLTIKWLSKIVKKERLDRMHAFYEKWGFFAFLVGRFVPFGIRNCLFISAGMGKMSFTRFLWIDGVASLISTTSAFYLAYTFGKNFEVIWEYIKNNYILFIAISAILLTLGVLLYWFKCVKKRPTSIND
jgi:membrane protein DedA with SNARE-associated domain